jgi:hypothetical protein
MFLAMVGDMDLSCWQHLFVTVQHVRDDRLGHENIVQGDYVPGIHTKSEGTQTEQHAPKTYWRDPHLEVEGVF